MTTMNLVISTGKLMDGEFDLGAYRADEQIEVHSIEEVDTFVPSDFDRWLDNSELPPVWGGAGNTLYRPYVCLGCVEVHCVFVALYDNMGNRLSYRQWPPVVLGLLNR